MRRKTVMSCIVTIFMILLMLSLNINAYAVERFDRKDYNDPKKFRIKATSIGSFYDKDEDEDSFGTVSVRYVIDNMDGDKWVSEAWAQKVSFRFPKTPTYFQDFGPGRSFKIIKQIYNTDNVLEVNEENNIDLDEGRYFSQSDKVWWAANGRRASTWLTNDITIRMNCSMKLKEKEPIDDYLENLKNDFMEEGPEEAERTVEEFTINGRRVLMGKQYYPLIYSYEEDYMVASHTFTGESADTIWRYYTIIEPEDFPEIYIVTTTYVTTGFRYEKTDASGEIDQYAEDLYQAYLKQLERTNNVVAVEMIGIEPEIIYDEPVIGKTVGKKEKESDKPGSLVIGSKANKESGERSVSIPEALGILIIGGVAALAGAGAGSGGSDGRDNKGKKKSRYKMCFKKDFGDAIRYDTQPATVYARIVEITPEGEEIDRPDLSASLEIFSGDNLTVEGGTMAGNYMGAMVSAQSKPGGQNPDEGVVSIRFSGQEGSFQNDITFRLIGKPYISFPEQGNYLTMTVPMLMGDGETYEIPLILHDFMNKPISVKLEVAEGVPLSCETEEAEGIGEANTLRYILRIKNLSAKPQGLQAVKQSFSVGIRAENEQELAENSLNIELYPEGLSIRDVNLDEKGRVLINTLDDETTEEWGDVKPTGFVMAFAVPEPDMEGRRRVRAFEPEEFTPVFAELKGTDERTNHLASRFKYVIKEVPGNLKEYRFAPLEALVEEKGKPYYLTLPISCSYGREEYTLDLPIRLVGGGPGPLAGWDEALANMKKIVSKVGGISPELARMLRENGKKMSTAELRLVTYRICHDTVIYYTKDAAEYEKIASDLDQMIYYAEWLKWFGDQAFSYLISTYYGDTADAILSPAKDIFTSFLGEVIGLLAYGEKFNWDELEVGKNINAALDNLICNACDDKMGSKISLKQVCAVVGGFVVWKIAKNIYDNIDNDGKVDLYSAITAAASDLTVMGMKQVVGKFFDKALKNKMVQENINTPLGKWLQDLVPDISIAKWAKGNNGRDTFELIDFSKSDVFKKYLEEIFGIGMAKITEIDMEAVKVFRELRGKNMDWTLDLSAWPQIDLIQEIKDAGGNIQAYKISINMGPEILVKLYDYLFGALFGNVPFAAVEKQPPIDPPYIPEEKLA